MINKDVSAFPIDDLEEIIFNEVSIQRRLKELGAEINSVYQGRELVVIAIINGAVVFVADIIRQLKIPLRIDCIRVSSYRDSTMPVQAPEIIDSIQINIKDMDVLLIDDILDTGNTLFKVSQTLQSMKPASLKTCVLVDKKVSRSNHFEADFVGFEASNQFLVGYGLDFAERYRQLPCIGVLKSELLHT